MTKVSLKTNDKSK